MDEIKLLQKLISFESPSEKSNRAIVDFIASLFPADQVKIVPLERAGEPVFNLIVKIPGQNHDRPLIFSGHTDTVPVSSGWTRNPFEGEIEGERIYGLGASDMKSGLAAFITAVKDIKSEPEQDIYLLFDADEEASCLGGHNLIKTLTFDQASIIVAEPTNTSLQIGQKGGLEIEATFFGQALHSSLGTIKNNRAHNAIHKAFEAFKSLQELETELATKKLTLFSSPTQSICKISGGTAGNVIPDKCSFTINRRLLPNENIEVEKQKIIECLKSVDPNVVININFQGDANLLALESSLFQIAAKVSRETLGHQKIEVMSGWTQAGLFNRWGDCLIWGPGSLEQAHQADEYCRIEDVHRMKKAYKRFIENYK